LNLLLAARDFGDKHQFGSVEFKKNGASVKKQKKYSPKHFADAEAKSP